MDDMLKLLEDRKWHDMKEIMNNSRLHDPKVEMVLDFLSEYDFIVLDRKGRKAKLTSSLYKFVRRIKLIEEKEAARELEVP